MQNCVIHLKEKIFSANIILLKENHSKFSKNQPVCMCKEGWCVGLWQEGGSLGEGGRNCLKYLKGGEIEKMGVEIKNLKRGLAG